MRLVYALALAAFLWVLPLALVGDSALAVFQCGMFDGSFSCRTAPGGEMHGKNANPGATAAPDDTPPADTTGIPQGAATPPAAGYGTPNAGQGAQGAPVEYGTAKPGEHACPPGYTVLAVPGKNGYCEPTGGTTGAASSGGCQHGMVGAPPNCHCPKNSELLGGNCVHYTATMCQSELPINVNPEPCQDVEAKLSCKMRQDGLKDCCCVTYDKL
jgi:hypothetical protein